MDCCGDTIKHKTEAPVAAALIKSWQTATATPLKVSPMLVLQIGTTYILTSLSNAGRKGGLRPASIFQPGNCTGEMSDPAETE